MRTRIARLVFGIFVCLPATSVEAQTADEIEPSVVKLHVTERAPDFFRPWTKSSPSAVTGSGVFIDGGRILTNAHVVMHASDVQVQLRRGGDKLRAKVTAIAPGIDLAIVELSNPAAVNGIRPLKLADDLAQPKSRVSVYGYPTGGDDLSVTDGIVSRIEFAPYYFGTAGLRVQIDAALNPGNSGGPAIQDGKIAGLVFSKIEEADNIGYLIPPEEIQAFLDDIADGNYDGRPFIWDTYYTVENAALRKYLQMPDDETGVVVGAPYRSDDDYPLKEWDVITHIGPHSIDNQSFVDVRDGLRLRFLYYVPKVATDGTVELTIRRDGETQAVHVPVSAERKFVIPVLKDRYPEYFICGPIVFTAATQEYVQALGRRGMAYLFAIRSPLLSRLYDTPREPGEQLVVVATRLFPHRITKGYDHQMFGVVDQMNGTKVKNLRHLAELLRDNTDEFTRFEFADRSESAVFFRDEINAATDEILTDEGIRYQASPALRDVWENSE